MDDLSSKINKILSDPQAIQQIKGLSQSLGLGTDTVQDEKKHEISTDLLSGLTGMQNDNTISLLSKIAPMLTNLNKEDDTTRLLKSLRPFLSDERRKKLDQAEKLMKMMKLLPLLKDTPLLDSLF